MARCLALPVEHEAYLAGLLHDLGIIELFEAHGEAYVQILHRAHEQGIALNQLEQEALGESHETRLLTRASEWNFPEGLAKAIGHHHTPLEAPAECRSLAMMLHAAHIIIPEPNDGWSDHVTSVTDEETLNELGLYPDDAEDIRALTQERLKEVSAAFSYRKR